MTFVISTAMIAGGLGLATDVQCYAAIRLCIAFYGAGKTTMCILSLYLRTAKSISCKSANLCQQISIPPRACTYRLCSFCAPERRHGLVDGILRHLRGLSVVLSYTSSSRHSLSSRAKMVYVDVVSLQTLSLRS
jgi:hypothetical protein